MKKIYVLDTNILLSDPHSIFGFEDNEVIITQTVLQELDEKKTAKGELGYNAREVARQIESLRKIADNGDLTNTVELENGGSFRIVDDDTSYLPMAFDKNRPDNRIIGTALHLQDKYKDKKVVLVTNDTVMRLIATSAHFSNVEEYKNDHVSEDIEQYKGILIVKDNGTKIAKINKYLNSKATITKNGLDVSEIFDADVELHENEFIVLENDETFEKCYLIYKSKKLVPFEEPKPNYNVVAKNSHQAAALYALLAPVDEIPLVILKGTAGTSKTFLSLVAGLTTTVKEQYKRVLISRNNVMADADFGYLPGEIQEKMTPLLAPFYDNLENIYKNETPSEDIRVIREQVDNLFDSGIIDICPLAYMRGRSITDSYLIVDETQNASRSQIRDIITRAGKGTKIILCGDPNQIDAQNLDKYNNGLVFAASKFIDSPLCAQITFDSDTCVRSELSREATNLLQF